MDRNRLLAGRVLACAATLLLAGCANMQTLNRDTSAPWGKQLATAIHLDAQQRLVVFAAEKYCAEPSPDALATYAAALGLTGSRLPNKSIAASAALNSIAGSIGLRTQSITLMRDTLYRTCEAAMNGYLSDEQVAILMARSQDLTAVVLAIEQLTGTVVAPPITLTTGTGSSAASTLLANAQALTAAKEIEAKAKVTRDEAATKRAATLTTLEASKVETQRMRDQAEKDPTETNKQLLSSQQAKQSGDQIAFDQADNAFNVAQQNYLMHQQTAEQISKLHDGSMSTTIATASGGANMGTMVYHSSLTDKSTEHISKTVKELVTLMLHKDYLADACMATLMKPSLTKRIEDRLSTQSAGNADSAWRSLAAEDKTALSTVKSNQESLTATCLAYFAKAEPRHKGEQTTPKEGQQPPKIAN